MKILTVTFSLPHPKACSGAALVMHGQIAALSARHEVTLVTFAVSDSVEKKALHQLRASGVKVHVVGGSLPTCMIRLKRHCEQRVARLRGGLPILDQKFTDPRMQHLLDRLLGKRRFDLFQVENIGVGNYRYKTQIPSVVTEHEVGRSLSDDPDDWQRHQPSIWGQFDRIQVFTPRDAAAIRTVAPELADRVRINPFGVDIPVKVDLSREEPGTIVFVGGFNHTPNVDAALWLCNEIMPILREVFPRIRLTLVGGYPPKVVQALAREDIVVTGRVPDVEPYLERAAVMVAPLRTGGGMRVKVLQAMAMGKAVVTTPLGAEGLNGIRDQLPLIIANDAENIAKATASILTSRNVRRTLGRRARAFVAEHHSWSAYGRRLEAIYSELQSKHRHNEA